MVFSCVICEQIDGSDFRRRLIATYLYKYKRTLKEMWDIVIVYKPHVFAVVSHLARLVRTSYCQN